MHVSRRAHLRSQPWGPDGGLAVYDPRSDRGFLLNPATAAVFEACDGHTDLATMAARVAERTGLPADPAIAELALDELAGSGLVEATTGERAGPGLSRRAVIRRLALGAGAAALLPLVDTVGGVSRLAAAPSVAQGGSPLEAVPLEGTTPMDTPVAFVLSTVGGFPGAESTGFQIADEPDHGTVELVGATATYTPDPGFVGTDSFTYIAWQCLLFVDALPCPEGSGPVPETGTDPATVTVTVTGPPDTTGPVPPTSAASPTTTRAAGPATRVTGTPRFTG